MAGYEFTPAVRTALMHARDHAARLGHEYVGTEHVLLALLDDPRSDAGLVLQRLGVEHPAVREAVESVIKRGTGPIDDPFTIPYTSRAKKVLELSMFAARERQLDVVDTGQVLLGLVRERMGIAAQVLASLGVTEEAATRGLSEIPLR